MDSYHPYLSKQKIHDQLNKSTKSFKSESKEGYREGGIAVNV